MSGHACSDTLLGVLNRSLSEPMELEEDSIITMAGGLMQHGYQCGLIWGASLAAGRWQYEQTGDSVETQVKSILLSKQMVSLFQQQNGTSNCYAITNIDQNSSTFAMVKYFLLKGGSVGCFRRAGNFAPAAFKTILKNKEISGEFQTAGADQSPSSCTAHCARELGATPEQAMMASGLAGGIGLSGGACGALATTIWLMGIEKIRKEKTKIDYFKFTEAKDLIEAFKGWTGGKMLCSEITGQIFQDPSDHSGFIRGGGCQMILQKLKESSGL